MGIIVVGFLLIGLIALVLFGEALNNVTDEPTEHRTAPSMPDANEMAVKSQARPEIPATADESNVATH